MSTRVATQPKDFVRGLSCRNWRDSSSAKSKPTSLSVTIRGMIYAFYVSLERTTSNIDSFVLLTILTFSFFFSQHQIMFESHKIICSDGVTIHSWLLFRDKERSRNLPTLVFFHGNAGNIGLRLPNALQMIQYLNSNVLMVEYRGYGESDSVTPSEAGLKLDAEAALRFIMDHPEIDRAKVFLFGRSLGGAVAFHLAQYAQEQHLPLAGVIVENTFTNIAEMVDHLMPFLSPLKFLILRIKWDSLPIVSKLWLPVLYIAGAKDELVPHHHMLR